MAAQLALMPADAIDAATQEILESGGWVPEIAGLEQAIAESTTYEEARQRIAEFIDKIGTAKLADLVARARVNARLAANTGDTLS